MQDFTAPVSACGDTQFPNEPCIDAVYSLGCDWVISQSGSSSGGKIKQNKKNAVHNLDSESTRSTRWADSRPVDLLVIVRIVQVKVVQGMLFKLTLISFLQIPWSDKS